MKSGLAKTVLDVVASVPPKLAVAECLGHLKGASSHTANESLGITAAFRWESGYGAASLGERSLPSVIGYVRNQREHHAQGSLIGLYEHSGAGGAPLDTETKRPDRQRPV